MYSLTNQFGTLCQRFTPSTTYMPDEMKIPNHGQGYGLREMLQIGGCFSRKLGKQPLGYTRAMLAIPEEAPTVH